MKIGLHRFISYLSHPNYIQTQSNTPYKNFSIVVHSFI